MKNILIICMFAFLFVLPCEAHAPTKIDLEYDAEALTLKIDIRHVKGNKLRHYVRKVVVYVNGSEAGTFYFHNQVNPSTVNKEMSLEAQPGDVIKVEAYCSEGGVKEGELVVPEENEQEDADNGVKAEEEVKEDNKEAKGGQPGREERNKRREETPRSYPRYQYDTYKTAPLGRNVIRDEKNFVIEKNESLEGGE